MDTIELPSKRYLEVKMAPFSKGTKLYKTIAKELTTVNIQLSSLNLQQLMGEDINSIKNAIFGLVGSDALELALFDVMKHSRINDEIITKDSFEAEETRGDYLVCAWEVAKFNLVPFFKNLELFSKASLPIPSDGQK